MSWSQSRANVSHTQTLHVELNLNTESKTQKPRKRSLSRRSGIARGAHKTRSSKAEARQRKSQKKSDDVGKAERTANQMMAEVAKGSSCNMLLLADGKKQNLAGMSIKIYKQNVLIKKLPN